MGWGAGHTETQEWGQRRGARAQEPSSLPRPAQPRPSSAASPQSSSGRGGLGSWCRVSGQLLTRLCVVHPIQDDLRRPVPPGHHVPSHLAICLPGQAKVQDLQPESEGGAKRSLGSGWASRGPEDPKGTGHTGASCQASGARGRSQVPLSLPAGSSPQPVHPAQPTVPAPDPYNRHPGGVSCPWTSAPCEPPGPSQHFWEGLLSPALARAQGAGDTARPSPQAGMPPCHPTQCLPRAHLPISCSATAWMAVVCPSTWAWASPPPGLRAKGPAGRWAGAGEAPSPQPNTHLELTVLVHGQVAGLQVLGAEERWLCSPAREGARARARAATEFGSIWLGRATLQPFQEGWRCTAPGLWAGRVPPCG